MKNKLLLALSFITVCSLPQSSFALSDAQYKEYMQSSKAFKDADMALNKAYKELRLQLKDDKNALNLLKKQQRDFNKKKDQYVEDVLSVDKSKEIAEVYADITQEQANSMNLYLYQLKHPNLYMSLTGSILTPNKVSDYYILLLNNNGGMFNIYHKDMIKSEDAKAVLENKEFLFSGYEIMCKIKDLENIDSSSIKIKVNIDNKDVWLDVTSL